MMDRRRLMSRRSVDLMATKPAEDVDPTPTEPDCLASTRPARRTSKAWRIAWVRPELWVSRARLESLRPYEIEAMESAVDHTDPRVRFAIAVGMAYSGDPRAIDHLVRMQSDSHPKVADRARMAVRMLAAGEASDEAKPPERTSAPQLDDSLRRTDSPAAPSRA